jgi:membrane protein required for colicin V production
LNALDFILIGIVILGAIQGYREGFLVELFSLIAILLGILGGFKLMGIALIYLDEYFDLDKKLLPYISFAAVFVLIVIVVNLTAKALKMSIDKTILGRVDQAAGSILGVVKWVFLLSVGLWIVDSIHWQLPEKWTADSKLLPYAETFAPVIGTWVGELIPAFNDIFS